ncbi:hypothetical protein [Bacteroides ovatus]|uniref:hypothetical protein n=1 Tax=Bacteroides ovatus TaxID=28116 RepID=UPI001F16BBF2|nr:hypothetical protein [Bacteroides ovatus]MCE8873760.1 hypothetical protein [Bacteroides ovatus]
MTSLTGNINLLIPVTLNPGKEEKRILLSTPQKHFQGQSVSDVSLPAINSQTVSSTVRFHYSLT